MWLILANLTDTAIQVNCIKAALSIIKWACRKKKKSAKNYKTLNRKESDILRSPMESVLSDCLNTSVLLSFPVQFVENRTQVSCTLTQRSIILSLPKAFEVVTKTCPVSLSWLPSWLTQKWHVKGAFANPLTSF